MISPQGKSTNLGPVSLKIPPPEAEDHYSLNLTEAQLFRQVMPPLV